MLISVVSAGEILCDLYSHSYFLFSIFHFILNEHILHFKLGKTIFFFKVPWFVIHII